MLRVGLTGGIACGKSTVARMFRDLDFQVLDADPLGHEMLEPDQPAYAEVVREFGDGILESDGSISRAKLGGVVFADPAKLERLNQIIHPRVSLVTEQWLAALDRPGGPAVAIVEAALLIEAGYRARLQRIIVVSCRPEQQLARLIERGLSEDQARQRIGAQMPIGEKVALADDVIDTSGTLEETRRQVNELGERLGRLGG
jgi:dephospho-CoA kinase